MVSRRLEDRIHELIAKAVAASDDVELEKVMEELRTSLKQHIERVRKMTVSNAPRPRRRQSDSGE